MKQNFKGWTSVYDFTFRQSTKGAGFKVVTALITLIIIGIIVAVTVITGKPEDKKTVEVSPIKSVYVLDQSGLKPTDFKALNPELSKEQFNKITFIQMTDQSREEAIKTAAADSKKSIAVILTTTEKGYGLEAAIPSESTITKGQAGDLLDQMKAAFESSKLMQSGLTAEQLTVALTPEVTSYSDIGENTNMIVYVIKIAAPMVFSIMLFFMLQLFGINVTKSVSTEKTSKLMETLLTSIHPYALITGKVLAVTSMALIQFVTWIIAAFVGLYGGNAIAHAMYPDYQNSAIEVFRFLKENVGETALTPPAILLAIVFFIIGFLFYCVIAGLAGCMVSKPEDAASTQQIYMMPVIISYLVVYLGTFADNVTLINIVRYIPFTAPFCVPAELLTGSIGLGQGVLTLAILVIFTLFVIMLSGRIYKGLILYSGQKISLKMIGNVIRSNQ